MSSPGEDTAPREICWSARTDPGKVRKNNEDAFLALTFDARHFESLGKFGQALLENDDFVFAVSDGMGGAQAGEFASKIAVEKITRILPKGFLSQARGLNAGFSDLLQEVFSETHKAITYLGDSYPECKGMGSTLTLIWITPQWLYFGHVGDSRLYYLPHNGPLKQLSEDHSHVGWLLRQGKINEREARTHPRRHSLNKVLGGGSLFTEAQTGAVGLEPGDRFVLCSDGIVEGLWDRNIHRLLTDPAPGDIDRRPADLLVEKAVELSGRDNTTAVVIEIA